MSLNGIFMALPGYHCILQGYYEGNFISFTRKSFGDIPKKCKMQQFKIAKIFGTSFLDFNPAWEKKLCRKGSAEEKMREREITLPPLLLLLSSPTSPWLIWNKHVDGGGGCCCWRVFSARFLCGEVWFSWAWTGDLFLITFPGLDY